MNETAFKERVVYPSLRSLESCWFVKTQQLSIRGTPDILGVLRGKFFALELKASKEARIAKLQEVTIDFINRAGGFARITYPENWDYVFECLKETARRKK